MTTDEKLAVIARAIIQLAARSATTWDYDGEQIVSTGVTLAEDDALRDIATAKITSLKAEVGALREAEEPSDG